MRPVLLSLITKLSEGQMSLEIYERTISFLYCFYVCYNIIGEENSNRLTDTVNKYAVMINKDCSEKVIDSFIEELRKKLPSEKLFINAFKNVGWSHHNSIYEGEKNKTRVQTVLEILERYNNNGGCADNFTIEHVLPDGIDSANGQIGNLIPLEQNLNEMCKTRHLEEKLIIYKDSSYVSARMFGKRFQDKEFDPEKRSEYLAMLFYEKILQL